MSQIYFIGVTLYKFRTIFPSITRSSILYIQQTGICQTDTAVCLLASSLELLMMDGKTLRNM